MFVVSSQFGSGIEDKLAEGCWVEEYDELPLKRAQFGKRHLLEFLTKDFSL